MKPRKRTPHSAAVDWLRRRIDEAFADVRPKIPAREVFKRLRRRHARRSA